MVAINRIREEYSHSTELKLGIVRQWGEFALIDASVGHTMLRIAGSTADSARRKKCVGNAQRVLQKLDHVLGRFEFEDDQLTKIVNARANLAEDLAATRALNASTLPTKRRAM